MMKKKVFTYCKNVQLGHLFYNISNNNAYNKLLKIISIKNKKYETPCTQGENYPHLGL